MELEEPLSKEKVIRFDKERKREFINIICPDCHRTISGTTQLQAEAMLKEHKRSKLHKEIVRSFNNAESSGAITINPKKEEGGNNQ